MFDIPSLQVSLQPGDILMFGKSPMHMSPRAALEYGAATTT